MSITMNQDMGASGNMDMKMVMELDVTNVIDDVYDSKIKFTKVAMNGLTGGQSMSFDSDMKDEELDEVGKMLKAQMGPMLNAVIFAKGNSLGEVTEIKIEPKIAGLDDIGNQLSSVVYPVEAVKVGSTWEIEKDTKGMKMKFIYTVKSISQENIILDITGNLLGLADGDISGHMIIDQESGVPMVSNIKMEINTQGLTVTSNINITSEKI